MSGIQDILSKLQIRLTTAKGILKAGGKFSSVIRFNI